MVLREQKLLHSLSLQRLESCLQMIRSFLYAGTSQKHSADLHHRFLCSSSLSNNMLRYDMITDPVSLCLALLKYTNS